MSSTYDNTVFDFDLDFLNQPPPNNAEPEPEPEPEPQPEPDLQAKCDRLRKSVIYFKKRVKVIDHYVTVAKAAKNEIAELRISEKKLKNQCKQHHVEIGNFIEKVTRLENDLQASVDRERQKSETISELENKIVATQNIHAQYKVLVEEHRLEPSRNKKGKAGVVNNAQKTLIEKEVETLRKNNAKFLNLDKVNEKLRKENARIPNLEKEIENLRKNNISENVNDHTDIARIKQLENEIEVLQKQNADIPKLEREMANLQKENTKISKLEKEVEYLQKENAKIPKLIKEIENLHRENVKLTKLGNEKETLSKLNIKISNLEKDYEILCIKHAAIETENKAFRKKIDSITSKAEDRITNLNAATKENGKLRTKHNKLARKYKSLPDRQSERSDDSEAEYDVFENPVLSPIPNDIIRKTSLIAGKDTAVPCEFDTEHSPEYLLYSPSNRKNIENEEKTEDTAMSGSPNLLKETETSTIIFVDHNENQSVCEHKSVETLLREREHRKSHSSNDEREASNSVTDTSDNVRPKKRTQEKEFLEINKSVSHRKSHSSNDEREASDSVTDTSDNVRPKKRTQEKECLEINKSVSHRKSHFSNDEREASNSVTDTSDNVRPKKHTQEKEFLEINKSVSHRKSHFSNDEREASNSVTDTSDNVRPKKRTQEKECLEINKSVSHRKSHFSNDEREASNSVTDTSDNVRPKKHTQEKEFLEINKSVSHRKSHFSNDEREASNSVTDTSDNVRPKKRTQEKEFLEINKSVSHRKSHFSNDEREASNSVTDTSDNVRPKKRTQEKEFLEINKSVSHRKSHFSNDEREASNSVTDTSDNVRPKKRTQEKEFLEINKSVSHRKSHFSNDEREASNSVTDTSDNVRPKKRTQEKEFLEINKSVSHRKSHFSNGEREASNSVTDTSDNVRPKKRTQEKEFLEINKSVSHRKSHFSNDEREASNSVTDTSDNVRPKKRTQEKEFLEINKSVSHRKSHFSNDEREASNSVTDTSDNVRPIKLSQEKECLEINNSLRCESHTELELENIFSTMKLNYNALSPIPKTPINVDPTPSPSEKFDRCSSLCYKTIDFMQTLIKMAVSQGRDRYKVNLSDCDKMIACFESILKAEQFLTETYPEHSVLNTNSNMELSDCVLGRDGNNLGTLSNPEPSTTSSQKETDIPQHKNCEKILSQNASLLEEENQNQLLCNDETSITISNSSSPDKVTNMNRDKQVENGLLQCLPMSLDENQLINHSVSEELATENGMSKATDSDGSSHDIVEVEQPPIIKKKRKNKKKTKLEKLKKKLEPKYKIRMEMTHPEKMRVKPKQIVPIKRKVTENDTSASLNRKEIYEKAVKFMAHLNSQQSAKQAETSPKHTNDIHKTPRHAACVEKDIESSSDNQVLHNCAISTRSKRKFSELFEPLLSPRKSENSTTHKATEDDNSSTHRSKANDSSTIHRAKEDSIINNSTIVTLKVIGDIESSNELPLRKRLRRYSDKPLNLFSMNAKEDKNSATDRSKQDNISTTHEVKEDTVLSSELPLRKRLRQSSDKPLNISLSNAKENSNSTSDIATKDNNSATNRAKEEIISTPQKLKEDTDELPLRKRLRRSSNEPHIQYKRVLRSATVHTKLCTEVNNELPKSKGKSSRKSIKGAERNESATQINDESTSHNSNVVSYVDLDLFSEDIQLERKMSETLRHSCDKPLNIISMNTKEDNNSTINRAKEGVISSNELPLQKGRRRSSNEPLIQSKRILRSSTVNTKLCTEDNIELTKSKGKSSKKSMVPRKYKSATQISNEGTLNNNNVVSYKDLDLFSEDIQLEKKISEMLAHLDDKPLNINSMNTEEYIKPSDELPLEKERRRSSNEPLKQYKAIFRSATLHTKLRTEDNIELSKSKGKNSTKSIIDPTENESVTQINNESTLLHNSDVVCSEDLEDFSDNLKIKNKTRAPEIEKNTDKSDCNPKDSILCHMIVKYGIETATRIEKRIPGKVVTKICGKIERDITIIIQNYCNQKAKDNLVADLGKLNYKYFIAGLMQFLAKPERKLELFGKVSGYPAPAMTKTEQILLDVIVQLKKYWPSVDIVDAVLSNIEFTLFKLNRTPDFDVIESVSHFYAVLCRFVKAQSRLRLFILDAMYCIQFKSVPLIKQCLEVWMSLIPLAHMGIAKSPMVTSLVYLLHFYKCDDRYNRVQELRKILRDQYFYRITNWSETKILEMFKNSIAGLRDIAIEKKMLRLALIILAKRRGPRWCQLHIVNNLLEPIIRKKNAPNNVKHFCVSLIGPLMKPYPPDMKIHCEIAINHLLDILDNNPPPELEEAAITSMMVINRHDQHSLNKMLLSRKMKPMSLTLEKTIRDYVKTRPFKVWEMHLSTIALELETYSY